MGFIRSMLSLKTLSWALLFLQPCIADPEVDIFGDVRRREEYRDYILKQSQKTTKVSSCNSTSCYRYYNSDTAPYFIKSMPDVNFDIGELYGGSVPIDESDPSRTLFFIFKPAQDKPVDEVTVWLNGGPGCSSLGGFFQENGPVLWQTGTQHPVRNNYAWSKLTNLLWVEQPVGTGFAQGKVTAHNEIGVAKDFVGFFKNWEKLFGIKDYKIYMTGESYAGRYVPYISAQMLDEKDKTYFDLSGALMYDPCIGDCGLLQGLYPSYYFALNNNEILNFNESGLAEMEEMSERCGYNAYLDTYLQYPPPGIQPPVPTSVPSGDCDISIPFDNVYNINPCYNVYHITDYCPFLWNVLDPFPQPGVKSINPYFNRMDVKQAIHAPLNVTWSQCADGVFIGHDRSPDPNLGVLPQVIEATNNVLVGNADWDGLLFTNGTLLAIQNMTWNGQLGFQSAPSAELVVPLPDYKYGAGPQGVMGKQHYERGLQWVETYQSGHMQPQYQPRVAYRHLQWLLGRIDVL